MPESVLEKPLSDQSRNHEGAVSHESSGVTQEPLPNARGLNQASPIASGLRPAPAAPCRLCPPGFFAAVQRTSGAVAGSVPCRTITLSAESRHAWRDYVDRHPDGTLFHSLSWRQAVREVFGHEEEYVLAVRDQRIVGVLPTFLVRSRLGGRMLVSVPYAVGGGIIAADEEAAEVLAAHAVQRAQELRCNLVDLRHQRAVAATLPIAEGYVGFRRQLPSRPDDVLEWLPRKARAAARNARDKYSLEASFGDHHLSEVWRLYTLSMRRLGSIAYPRSFFESLIEHMPDQHWTLLVRRNGRPVAGLLTFLHRDAVLPYFVGMTDDARRYSAANFVYFTVMERAVAEGYGVFDFGRSRRDNHGSFDFKRLHGFTPRPLEYQFYVPPGRRPVPLRPDNPRFRIARRVWSHLPLWMTQVLGARLARHIPG
ncbi:MAG: FemAB family XrtA/PEP-CTERM system-associated protein [Planctomycetota bacterium]